jgi:hypothetical protein
MARGFNALQVIVSVIAGSYPFRNAGRTPMTKVFEIPETKLNALTLRANKIAQRARRANFPVPTIKVLETKSKTIEVYDPLAKVRGHGTDKKHVGIMLAVVEVEGCEPRLGQWDIVGYRYMANDRAGATHYFKSGEVPGHMTGALCCDHCNTKRKRRETMVVKSDEGEFKEIGSTCLADFTGVNFNEGFLGSVRDAGVLLGEIEKASNWSFNDADIDLRDEVRNVLAVAASIVRADGFVSSRVANESGQASTSSLVAEEMYRLNSPDVDPNSVMVIETDFQQADQIIAFFKARTEEGDFYRSVRSCLDRGLADRRDIGLLAAAAGTYLRAMEIERGRENGKAVVEKSTHVGEIGKSETFVATVKDQRHVTTAYSDFWAITLVDGSNNLYSWLTNNKQDFVTGDRYEFKGTVKKHEVERYGDFQGASVTQLKNVKAKQRLAPEVVIQPPKEAAIDDELNAVLGI